MSSAAMPKTRPQGLWWAEVVATVGVVAGEDEPDAGLLGAAVVGVDPPRSTEPTEPVEESVGSAGAGRAPLSAGGVGVAATVVSVVAVASVLGVVWSGAVVLVVGAVVVVGAAVVEVTGRGGRVV